MSFFSKTPKYMYVYLAHMHEACGSTCPGGPLRFCFELSAQVIRLMNEANTLQEAGNFDGSNAAVEKVRQVGAENTDA